jgi:tRNA dimethylallyltransferase
MLIAIVGSTATGKSSLAHSLAINFGYPIVSADSRLVYKKMDIATAKPTKKELTETHYEMIDLVEPNELYSLGKYLEEAVPKSQNLLNNHKNVLVVGGTGFYLRGLLEGLPITDTPPNRKLRESLNSLSNETLVLELNKLDLQKKWKIQSNDRVRLIRAIEIESSPEKNSEKVRGLSLKAEDIWWIGLKYSNRDLMREKIKQRTQTMISSGLIEETQTLLREYGRLEIFERTIGYSETMDFLEGKISSEGELIDKISISTSQYAKRQMTWFKTNKAIQWFDVDEGIGQALNLCLSEF